MKGQSVSPSVAEVLAGDTVVCRDWAEQDLGPYYLERSPLRRDVTEDRLGVPLVVGLALGTAAGSPLAAASVEIWHCDAAGVYSGYPSPDMSSEEGPANPEYSVDRTFLRGTQESDGEGMVEFHTIYPGWYPGRTVHIHVIVKVGGRVFTSQRYFPDELTDEVFRTPPYSERPGRDTTNTTDGILPTGGEPAVMTIVPASPGFLGAARLHLPIDDSLPLQSS